MASAGYAVAALAWFVCLHPFNALFDWESDFLSLSIAMGTWLFLAFLIFFLLFFIFGKIEISFVLFFLVFISLFFFGPLKAVLLKIPFVGALFSSYFFWIIFLPLPWILVWYVLKTRENLTNQVFRFLKIGALVLFGFQLTYLGYHLFFYQPDYLGNGKAEELARPAFLSGNPPDIFYLILDARTSPEALQEHWDYNDSSMVSFLKEKNFQVLQNPKSNYTHTTMTVASVLNMDYVEALLSPNHRKNEGERILIKQALFPLFLKQAGYELINWSPFRVAEQPPAYLIKDVFGMTFSVLIFDQTFLGKLIGETVLNDWFMSVPILGKFAGAATRVPDQNLETVNRIIHFRKLEKPAFVYAHLMMPHAPYAFKRDGSRYSKEEFFSLTSNEKQLYLEQLIFSNKLLKQMVSSLLPTGKENRVVIIQGDHGFRLLTGPKKTSESFSILHAIYTPRNWQINFPENHTPVNSFRLILNKGFGMSLDLKRNHQVE